MKRIVKTFLLLLSILCVSTVVLGSMIVMAEEMSVSVVYQQDNNCWKIAGTAGSDAHKAITLKIYKSENGSLTNEALLNKDGLIKLVYTSQGGAFSDSIDFGTFFSSGSYTVEVLSAGFSGASTSFLYVNPDEAASIIERINSAQSKEDVAQILADNCYQLGIDEVEYGEKSACIDEIIFNRKPENGYNTQSFLREYNNALCVYDLKYGSDILENIFQKHDEAILFDYTQDISVHGNEIVVMLRERLKNADYNTLSIDRAIKEELIVSRILCATRYTYIEGIISEEIADGAYDLGDYSSVKNKENVFKALYNDRNKIEKYEDVKTLFESSAKSVLNTETNTTDGGGSGSGGGGGSLGGGSSENKKADISITEAEVAPEKDVLIEYEFTDTKNHWAADYVTFMARNAIASGYPDGTFRPEGFVTRAEFVKFIAVAFKLTEKNVSVKFEDVSSSDWFYPYITIAASNGVAIGFNGNFNPNGKLSRQDAAVILGRLTDNSQDMFDGEFNDEAEISIYAKESVKKLAGMGVIQGADNNFMPLKNITRAEAAAMIVRILGE